jgi:tetratricopeptide (TPR) repeat protein
VSTENTSLDSIFCSAIEISEDEERAAYVARACGNDANLKRQAENLIAAHFQAGSFLEKPVAAPAATGAYAPGPAEESARANQTDNRERPGTVIGPYKLMEQIGEGGMGLVFVAEQQEPIRRKVALKIIKPGMDTRQVVARFEAERQALALMDHPNIAKVYDGGVIGEPIGEPSDVSRRVAESRETRRLTPLGSPRPYFVMELVKGVPITEYCDQNQVPVHERLELFLDVCQAVQHAHQKGIIHRDIKPSNVLIMSQDGTPLVKVIDFGVAKAIGQQLTDKTIYTQFTQLVGTPLYMSPEQAGQSGLDVDTRSDIYSLGVLLYELLTGTTPFDKDRFKELSYDELRRVIREEEPPKPSTRISTLGMAATTASANRKSDPKHLSRLFRGELDWIVMKALEKDRNRRYESASAFAADVQRYLADEPVLACPPSAWYRLRKFTRRHKTGLAVASLILFCIALLSGGGGWAVRDRAARQQRLTAQVEMILDEVDRLEREQKWPEAQAAADRAEAALAGGEAGEAIRRRVAEARRDLAFVARLDRIRQDTATLAEGRPNYAGAARAYPGAFRDYGVDVEALPTDDAVARLRANPALAVPVAAALDDWVYVRRGLGQGEPPWRPLVAVARGLDPDPRRDRLRAMWGRPVTPELQAELLALAKSPDLKTQSPATLFILATTLDRADLADAALRVQQAGQYAYPADFWLSFRLGYQLVARNDYAGAVRYCSVAVSLRPDFAGARNNLAIALAEQGKLDEAIAEFHKAIALDRTYAQAHSNLGRALAEQGKWEQAMAEYNKAIKIAPKYPHAHFNLGCALDKQGELDKAVAEFRKAIELDPNNVRVYMNLGNALRSQDKLDEAIAAYGEALRIKPDSADAHNSLGNALDKQGKLDQAVVEFHKAIASDPKHALAHFNLGRALDKQGELDKAVAEFRKAIQLDSKYAPAHNSLGIVLEKQGKRHQAVSEYRKAIELDAKHAPAHYNLGNVFTRDGKRADAIAEYRLAITADPKYALAHHNLGVALYKLGKRQEAIAEWRLAVASDPKYAQAHYSLGVALAEQREWEDAVTELGLAIEIKPAYAEAHYTLGRVMNAKGRLDEAIIAFSKAIRMKPDFAIAHFDLGRALGAKGRLGEEIGEYRKAIRLNQNNVGAYSALASVLASAADPKLRDSAEALKLARKAVELAPTDDGAWQALGWALYGTGAWKESIAAFRKSMELQQAPKGGDPGQWFGLAAAYGKLGQQQQARTWYARAVQWMEKNALQDPGFRRYRAEADQVLGVKDKR